MTDVLDDAVYGDTHPNNLPQDSQTVTHDSGGDGLPGVRVPGYPGLRAGVSSGNGLLGIWRVGDHGTAAPTQPVAGANNPLTNPTDNFDLAGPASAPGRLSRWDPIVDREVAKFNNMNGADPGDDVYLDPDLVKAMIMTESGFNNRAYNSDPMQVNKSTRDWDTYKAEIGLTEGRAPGPDLGIRAGLAWLDSKAYHFDKQGRPGPFLGWQKTVTAYNGRGNPNYWSDVQTNLDRLKNGSH